MIIHNYNSKIYIAIDLKSFYASVECIERGLDPLKAKLVVADASRTDKTICLAVSPALKMYGIPGRARLFEVNQKVEEIYKMTNQKVEFIIAPPQMAKYIETSCEIYKVYLKYISPQDIHVYSIDEVFLDVTNYFNIYKMSPEELATKIVNDVYETTGITATAGIGSNLYLCKIAMDIMAKHAKENDKGVRIARLDEISYRKQLWNHKPLTDFWRIGRGTVKRLAKLGIFTMGDLAKMSLVNEDVLFKEFGVDAEILIDHAWGYETCTMEDIKNYKTKSNSLSSGQVLSQPYTFFQARTVLKEMVDAMTNELLLKKIATNSVTITIGYDRINIDNEEYNGSVVLDHYGRVVPKPMHKTARLREYTNSNSKIKKAVVDLYDAEVDKSLYVRRITLNANDIKKQNYEQLSLFEDYVKTEKEANIEKAALEIKKRFGKNMILKGTAFEKGATSRERNNQIGGHKA
ncbi:DNA methylase [Lachnobacterium bovis]|uniref:Y-family DNA polymerase n=1 Tax=Lachnobacterium bovis TaxID=140626 RepID=UPI00048ECF7C|nr:DNA methylase [Lachnobacterium bovis]